MSATTSSSGSTASVPGATLTTGVIVQTLAWGYIPLEVTHPGVVAANRYLHSHPESVNWNLMAEIAHLAGHAADDLVIVGGDAVAEILREVQDALVAAAIAKERGRR